ncbi:hypothetical protein [Kineosporia sp. R_H_3]|uniref:hypothetical protein n=1 Tax=Kineosporia sp. R_H_3 TaxID=1961848 RepID=UPI00130449A9|nr:hypothetical protein [Kineosporia sp. R_H_3]
MSAVGAGGTCPECGATLTDLGFVDEEAGPRLLGCATCGNAVVSTRDEPAG